MVHSYTGCPSVVTFRLLAWLSIPGALVFGVSPSLSDDWPQWRGPARNGVSRESGWLKNWPENAEPKVAWRQQVGKGHSGVAVKGDLAIAAGWDGERDHVRCMDVRTGDVLWTHSYPSETIVQWPGPRATPTIDGDTAFTLGQHGLLFALDARTGRVQWQKIIPKRCQPDADYGFVWSPLIQKDLLILSAGRTGLALRKTDGSVAWGDDKELGACASPVPFMWQGKSAVAMVLTDPGRESVRLVGVEAATGKELWRFGPWKEKWGAACADLLVHEGSLFVATAEQFKRCARIDFAAVPPREKWSGSKLSSYTASAVLLDGYLYGVDKTGILRCLEWESGTEKWSQRGFGDFGSLIASDGKLLVQTARTGELVIVAAEPGGYREIRRAKVFESDRDTFTAPTLSNGRLFCRSYAGEVVCLDLRN
jgi:outer membrane protein assembly factor BamB